MTLNLFCISDDELAADRAALSPADRAALDALEDAERSAGYHEEILAGLAGEFAHSRIRTSAGVQVRWTYNADGSMDRATLPAPTKKRDARRDDYTGPFPRKRHYHRCPECQSRGSNGVNCYKQRCTTPVLMDSLCSWCRLGGRS